MIGFGLMLGPVLGGALFTYGGFVLTYSVAAGLLVLLLFSAPLIANSAEDDDEEVRECCCD
jgi:MFS family permease